MEERVKDILWNYGIRSMNGELFQRDNHMMDNSIISHFEDILGGESWYGIGEIVGYSESPAFERKGAVAIMMETLSGEDVWCHIPEVFLDYDRIERALRDRQSMRTSLRIGWKDYRYLFPDSPLKPFSRFFFCNSLVKTYSDRYDGFPGAQRKYGRVEEYSFEGVTKMRWGWFLLYLIPCIMVNLMICLWSTGLRNFPRITRTMISMQIQETSPEFRRADEFWKDRRGR